jgi:hypothetical protein
LHAKVKACPLEEDNQQEKSAEKESYVRQRKTNVVQLWKTIKNTGFLDNVIEKIILAFISKNTYNTSYTRDKCLSQSNRRIKV